MAKLNFNRVIIGGSLGRDAEIRNFSNGGGVMNLSVATTESWKDKENNWQEKTTWVNVKVFGKSVDYLAPKCVKGASVLVEGIINVDEYEKDGVIALLLHLNGKMIEWVYKENISQCLKSKRVASREVGGERVVFTCKKVKALLQEDKQAKYGIRLLKVLD